MGSEYPEMGILLCFSTLCLFLKHDWKCIKDNMVSSSLFLKIHEPQHDKINKMTSEDSDQPRHQSSLCAQGVAKDPSFLHADSEDSNQTGRMPRLIYVIVFVFVVRRLK